MLSDRTSLIRAENVVPLYRRNELTERQVLALNEVAGELDTAALADMRAQVADGTDPGWWPTRCWPPTRSATERRGPAPTSVHSAGSIRDVTVENSRW